MIWYSKLVFKFSIYGPTQPCHMSTNVPDNPDFIVAFSFEADTHVDLVLISPLFFFMYFTTIFLNCVTGIKYLPYVWSRVYSPIYRYSEYLPYTIMFCASIFSPPAPISNQNISLLSACPHEYFFFSIYFMSSYDQYHISSEYFPQSVSLLFQYIVFPSEYFPFSVANFRVSSFSCLCYSHFPLIFTW